MGIFTGLAPLRVTPCVLFEAPVTQVRCEVPHIPGRPLTHSFRAVVTGSEMVEDGMTAKPGGGLLTGTDRPGGGGGFFNSTTELKPEGSREGAGIRDPQTPG